MKDFIYALGIVILALMVLSILIRWYYVIQEFVFTWRIKEIFRKIANRHKGEPIEKEMFDLIREIDGEDLNEVEK